MLVKGAIFTEAQGPFKIVDLVLDEPRDDEVQVKIVATGICNTDDHIRNQTYKTTIPAVLGHEGAGIVKKVGKSVTTVAPGDHVILGWDFCGKCKACRKGNPGYCINFWDHLYSGHRPDGTTAFSLEDGTKVASHFFGQSSFASTVNAKEAGLVKIDNDLPLELLGSFGCGMRTGAGAIVNSMRTRPGETVAVFGAGGVGMAAIMAASAIGAGKIIAIDVQDSRLSLATNLGATHALNSKQHSVLSAIEEITNGEGVDVAVDTTGIPKVIRQSVDCLGTFGRAGLIAVTKPGTEVTFEVGSSLAKGWEFRTISGGDAVPHEFITTLTKWWKNGQFPIEKLIKTYPLEEINQAFEDSKQGRTIKPVLLY